MFNVTFQPRSSLPISAPAKSRKRWGMWVAPLALAASQLALAGTTATQGPRGRAEMAPLRVTNGEGAARAAEGGREVHQGRELSELIVNYTRWFFSIPVEVNSVNPSETGANCGLNQDGAVFNLIGQALPTFTINCTVPAGRPIFMPALAYSYDFPCPAPFPQPTPGQSLEAFLRGQTAGFIDGITFASITLDGKQVKLRRASTGVHSFTGAKSWGDLDPCVTGSPQLVQNDGLWALIDPPSVGRHVVKLSLTHPAMGVIDGTWILNVTR